MYRILLLELPLSSALAPSVLQRQGLPMNARNPLFPGDQPGSELSYHHRSGKGVCGIDPGHDRGVGYTQTSSPDLLRPALEKKVLYRNAGDVHP